MVRQGYKYSRSSTARQGSYHEDDTFSAYTHIGALKFRLSVTPGTRYYDDILVTL